MEKDVEVPEQKPEESKLRFGNGNGHQSQYPHLQNNNHHVCINQAEIARLSEKVKTLFLEYDKLNETLATINATQKELLVQITNLGSIINTLKWTITIMIAFFGGLFVFILSEVIKLIH